MTKTVKAVCDPALGLRVVSQRELRYRAGPDPALDRPAHVRAASDLAWIGRQLVVLQDDASFLATLDPDGPDGVEAVTLPPGEDGLRQHDTERGTKALKYDLEAAVAVPTEHGPVLVAFGSGSTERRERVVLASGWGADGPPRVRERHAHRLYAQLRQRTDFAGSELNVEGALYHRGVIRLLQRGNGAPSDTTQPVDAIGELAWEILDPYLHETIDQPPPLTNVTRYDLGTLAGSRLTFTSGAASARGWLYTAAAEDSPDAIQDGPVAGSALGVVAPDGTARFARLPEAAPELAGVKIEGLAPDPRTDGRVFLVADPDDPQRPATLYEVALTGPWRG